MRGRKYDEQNAAMEMRDEESDDMEDMEEQEEMPTPPRRKIRGVQASRMMGAGSGSWISGAQRQAQSQAKSAARKKARMTASYGMQSGY